MAWASNDTSCLNASHGVQVERIDPLVYRVTYKGKSVLFDLNDLSQVKPPAGALRADEKFLGPIFDELAIRFFLVFNTKLKIFHYVLDETEKVHDEFFNIAGTDRILIGKRTGFAFYQDHKLRAEDPDRRLLVQFSRQQLLRRAVRSAAR